MELKITTSDVYIKNQLSKLFNKIYIFDFYKLIKKLKKNPKLLQKLTINKGINCVNDVHEKIKLQDFEKIEYNIKGKIDLRKKSCFNRICKIIISNLTKLSIIHLYSLGIEDDRLIDFELEMI